MQANAKLKKNNSDVNVNVNTGHLYILTFVNDGIVICMAFCMYLNYSTEGTWLSLQDLS